MPTRKYKRAAKRKRVFYGTPRHLMPRGEAPADAPEAPVGHSPSTSQKKLRIDPTLPGTTSGTSRVLLRPRTASGKVDTKPGVGTGWDGGSSADSWGMTGYRAVACENLVSLASLLKCPDCDSRSLSVDEDIATRRGLVSRIAFRCAACGWFHYISDSYDSQQTLVNTRSVLAARMIGKGQSSLNTFCGMMDLPPPLTSSAFSETNKKLLEATEDVAREQSISAAKELHAMSANGTLFVPPPVTVEADNSDDEGEGHEDETRSADVEDGPNCDDITVNFSQDVDDHDGRSPDCEENRDGIHGKDDLYPPVGWVGEPVDITVTFDGTWSKRGFTANYGVVAVISWDTGRVLDTVVLSKYCAQCSRMRGRFPDDSEEYKEWYALHEPKCSANHKGSSPAMEMEGAKVLWSRSVERLNLRYTTVVSDGDSKTIQALNEMKPYGEDVPIVKHECVVHVQKRVGKAIINLHTNPPSEEVEVVLKMATSACKATRTSPAVAATPAVTKKVWKKVTIGGVDGITKDKYLTLQQLYGDAIRANIGDLDGMVEACQAVFYHTISTDRDPQHEHCPKGPDSWCQYQRAIATFQELPHHRDPTDRTRLIPLRLAKYVEPIFIRLSKRSLLERCVLGATQNQNESFHHVVWSRCSKTVFVSPESVRLSVNLAKLTFNAGMKSLVPVFERLGVSPGPLCLRFMDSADATRIRNAEARESVIAKNKRKAGQKQKAADEERKRAAEGVTYGAGAFHSFRAGRND